MGMMILRLANLSPKTLLTLLTMTTKLPVSVLLQQRLITIQPRPLHLIILLTA